MKPSAEKFFKRPIRNVYYSSGGLLLVWEAEERSWPRRGLARNLMEMSQLKVSIISIIIGEGGSGGSTCPLAVGIKYGMTGNIQCILFFHQKGFLYFVGKDASRLMRLPK